MILLKDEAEKVGADGDLVLTEVRNYLFENGVDVDNIATNEEFKEFIQGD